MVEHYSTELGEEIAMLIALDYTRKEIAEMPGMPSERTMVYWSIKNAEFCGQCARARITQADTIAEKIAQIMQKVQKGELTSDQGRVIISGMQWLASKKNPKQYGDKVTLAGDEANPLTVLAARLDNAINRTMIDVTPVPSDGSDLV